MTISVHPCSLHSHIMYVSFIKLFKSGSNCPSYSQLFIGPVVAGVVEVVMVELDEVIIDVVIVGVDDDAGVDGVDDGVDAVVDVVVMVVLDVVDWVVTVVVVVPDEHKISGTLYFQSHTDKSGLNLRSEGHWCWYSM